MNQASFRQFLSAPRTEPSASSTSRNLGGPGPKRGYQPPPPKKEKPIEGSSQAFKPRKVKNSVEAEKVESKYQDRASQRRAGLEDEYSSVIALKDEFERRAAAEGEEGALLEEKRKYLGGDADHSILVKGLDFALLAKNKAELEASQTKFDDDELEEAFIHGQASTSSFDPDPLPASKKRTREEILAAVQSKKRALSASAGQPEQPARLSSKFKPIGEKEKKKEKKTKTKVVEGLEGEKKMRKKKKKVLADLPVDTPPSLPTDIVPPAEVSTDALVPPSTSTGAAPRAKVFAKPLIQATFDDDDIFGGVGDYEPDDLDDESADDLDELPKPHQDASPPTHNWFTPSSTSTSTSQPAQKPTPSPPSARSPPSPKRAPPSTRSPSPPIQYTYTRPYSRSLSRSPTPPTEGRRLVPLSGSAVPSVKELLAHSEEAEAMRLRKSKKAAWRAKQGLAKQDDGGEEEDDGGRAWRKEEVGEKDDEKRLNREYRQYERFQKKKEMTGE